MLTKNLTLVLQYATPPSCDFNKGCMGVACEIKVY